jgi:hypothetical protein
MVRTAKKERTPEDSALEIFLETPSRGGEITLDGLIDHAMGKYLEYENSDDNDLRSMVTAFIQQGEYLRSGKDYDGLSMKEGIMITPAGMVVIRGTGDMLTEVNAAIEIMGNPKWIEESSMFLIGYFESLRKLMLDDAIRIAMMDCEFKHMLMLSHLFALTVSMFEC